MINLLLILVVTVLATCCLACLWWLRWAMKMYCRAFQRYAEDNQIPPITREQLVKYTEAEGKSYWKRVEAKLWQKLNSKSN